MVYIHLNTILFYQGAIPKLLENTKEEFFNRTVKILRETADICWEKLKGINSITCPSKPEGSMFVMVCESLHILFHAARQHEGFANGVQNFHDLLQVKLDLSCLQDIKDDMDFCCRLAKEELVVLLPGILLLHTLLDRTDHCICLVQDIFFIHL